MSNKNNDNTGTKGCIHLTDELTTKCINDTSYRWNAALANKVKVEHTLYSSGLHSTVRVLAAMFVVAPISFCMTIDKVHTIQNILFCCGKEHCEKEFQCDSEDRIE